MKLFFAQGDERIDAGGALRGDVTGEKRDARENRRSRNESRWIAGADFEKHRAENARDDCRSDET